MSVIDLATTYRKAVDKITSEELIALNKILKQNFAYYREQVSAAIKTSGSMKGMDKHQQEVLILHDLSQIEAVFSPRFVENYLRSLAKTVLMGEDIGRGYGEWFSIDTEAILIKGMLDIKAKSAELVRTMVYPLEAVVESLQPVGKIMGAIGEQYSQKMTQLVTAGIGRGDGIKVLERQLARNFALPLAQINAIVETQVLNSFNQVSINKFKDWGVEFIQIISFGDAKVCPTCAYRNLKVFPINSVRVTSHPRCRCSSIPWRQAWQDKGLYSLSDMHTHFEESSAQFSGNFNTELTSWEKSLGLTNKPEVKWKPDFSNTPKTVVEPTKFPVPTPTAIIAKAQIAAGNNLSGVIATTINSSPKTFIERTSKSQPRGRIATTIGSPSLATAIEGNSQIKKVTTQTKNSTANEKGIVMQKLNVALKKLRKSHTVTKTQLN